MYMCARGVFRVCCDKKGLCKRALGGREKRPALVPQLSPPPPRARFTVALDACEQRGLPITQHDRLGDKAINSHNATQRHNEGLAAIYTAIRCASTTANAVRMGDKGDGTPCGKAEAGRRHALDIDGGI